MNKFVLRQSFLLLLTATIWGVAFVAQSVGMDYVGPFTFNATRNLIGAVVLLPCIGLLNKINGNKNENLDEKNSDQKSSDKRTQNKLLLTGGICCGVVLYYSKHIWDCQAIF